MYRENVNPSWVPQVGQKFSNLDDAWSFWVNYGGRVGFEVRKRYTNESSIECCLLVDNALDCLSNQLKDKLSVSTSILSDSYNVQPNIPQDEDMLSAARLKKKDIQPKNPKRHRSWLDKTRKFTKKVPNESNVCC